MNDQDLFDELRRAAEQLAIAVRIEAFETPAIGGGGRCLFHGESLVLIDARASIRDRINVLARALAEVESDAVFMLPEARDVVDGLKGAGSRPTDSTQERRSAPPWSATAGGP